MVKVIILGTLLVSLTACEGVVAERNPQKNPQGAIACKPGETVYYWNTGQLFKVACGETTALSVVF